MEQEKKGNYRTNIFSSVEVDIILQGDRIGEKIIRGKVKDILTTSLYHPYGIMVRLEDGKIGRVQRIYSNGRVNLLETDNESSIESGFKELVSKGENESIEYKSSALWSKDYSQEQIDGSKSKELSLFGRDASKIIVARTLVGFLNTDGGHLIIGIKENKNLKEDEIIGIESEFPKLKDPCVDGYRRMIVDEIIRKYFHSDIYNHLSKYIKISFPQIDGKTLCWFQIKKSNIKVFLTINKKDYFYIRIDAETRELEGKQMVDYCDNHFN